MTMRAKTAHLMCRRLVTDDADQHYTHKSAIWILSSLDEKSILVETQQLIHKGAQESLDLIASLFLGSRQDSCQYEVRRSVSNYDVIQLGMESSRIWGTDRRCSRKLAMLNDMGPDV